MKKLTTIVLLVFALVANAQISTTNSKISKEDVIVKVVKVYDCQSKVPAGTTLKTETVKKGKDKTYTITSERKIKTEETIPVQKDIRIRMTNFAGKASLFTKEDKPGKVYVDYWLNPINTIPANVNIKTITRSLKCPVDVKKVIASDYEEDIKPSKTTEKLSKYLFRLEADEYNSWRKPKKDTKVPDWFTHTDLIIEVYMANGKLGYALVDKYDRDVTYELEIKNRAIFTSFDNGIEYSPLTIPLKVRYGFTKNSIQVKDEFLADANLGAFMGIRIKKFTTRKEQNKLLNLTETALRIGPFVSLATVSLNKNNTTVGTNPIIGDNTQSLGTFSYGLGVIINIKNLNIGVFQGWESGFGSEAKNWNFNNKPFLGIGLGYSLNNFIKE